MAQLIDVGYPSMFPVTHIKCATLFFILVCVLRCLLEASYSEAETELCVFL